MNNTGNKKDEHNNAKNDPVKSKNFKPMLLKIIYKEPDGEKCNNKCNDSTDP